MKLIFSYQQFERGIIMSEQEKRNAIEAEGTITEAPKKDPWYVRAWRHPITKKVVKVVGVVGGIVGAGLGGYELGLHAAANTQTSLEEKEPARIEESMEETAE